MRDLLAFQYPYVLAFEPTFVEIRNVETGSMSQVIQGNNLRRLFTDTPPSLQQAYPLMSRSSLSSYNGGGSPGPGPGPYAAYAQHQYPQCCRCILPSSCRSRHYIMDGA